MYYCKIMVKISIKYLQIKIKMDNIFTKKLKCYVLF